MFTLFIVPSIYMLVARMHSHDSEADAESKNMLELAEAAF
jgi:hypothetical protein